MAGSAHPSTTCAYWAQFKSCVNNPYAGCVGATTGAWKSEGGCTIVCMETMDETLNPNIMRVNIHQ